MYLPIFLFERISSCIFFMLYSLLVLIVSFVPLSQMHSVEEKEGEREKFVPPTSSQTTKHHQEQRVFIITTQFVVVATENLCCPDVETEILDSALVVLFDRQFLCHSFDVFFLPSTQFCETQVPFLYRLFFTTKSWAIVSTGITHSTWQTSIPVHYQQEKEGIVGEPLLSVDQLFSVRRMFSSKKLQNQEHDTRKRNFFSLQVHSKRDSSVTGWPLIGVFGESFLRREILFLSWIRNEKEEH